MSAIVFSRHLTEVNRSISKKTIKIDNQIFSTSRSSEAFKVRSLHGFYA